MNRYLPLSTARPTWSTLHSPEAHTTRLPFSIELLTSCVTHYTILLINKNHYKKKNCSSRTLSRKPIKNSQLYRHSLTTPIEVSNRKKKKVIRPNGHGDIDHGESYGHDCTTDRHRYSRIKRSCSWSSHRLHQPHSGRRRRVVLQFHHQHFRH